MKTQRIKPSEGTTKENKPSLFLYILYIILIILVVGLFSSSKIYKSKIQLQQKSISVLEQKNHQNELENKNLLSVNSSIKKELKELKKLSLLQFTNNDLMKDIILHYPQISLKVKKQIITAVLKYSAEYNINPLITYSMLHTESSMRPWIEHPPRYVTINKKKVKIRAVGIAGIVWEFWGEKLKKAGIAEVRSDLFNPTINIRASVFIYNELYKIPKLKKAHNQEESAMMRYFGGSYRSYILKIDYKVAQLINSSIYRKGEK